MLFRGQSAPFPLRRLRAKPFLSNHLAAGSGSHWAGARGKVTWSSSFSLFPLCPENLATKILSLLFVLSNIAAFGQLPTNNLASGGLDVATDTNGLLIAPANFFAANSNSLNAAVNGLHGSGGANLVPGGANYDNAAAWGYPQYTLGPVVPTATYFLWLPQNDENGNDQGVLFNGDHSGGLSTSGIFIPGTNRRCQLFAQNPSTAIKAQVYLVTNFYGGNFGGNFYGYGLLNLDPASTVSDSSLTNVQFQNSALFINNLGGHVDRIISSIPSRRMAAAPVSLIHLGSSSDTVGYADINFELAANDSVALGGPTLYFAIGIGEAGTGIYNQPYLESYLGQYPFYFVGAGDRFGGFRGGSGKGNWVWFGPEGTNNVGVEWDYFSHSLSNYWQRRPLKATSTIARLGGFDRAHRQRGNRQQRLALQVTNNTALNTATANSITVSNLITGNGAGLTNVPMVSSTTVPMGAWFTNNVADGAALTAATALSNTNARRRLCLCTQCHERHQWPLRPALGLECRHRAGRYPRALQWHERSHRNQCCFQCPRCRHPGQGDSESSVTWGSAISVTNHISTNSYISREAITLPLTIGKFTRLRQIHPLADSTPRRGRRGHHDEHEPAGDRSPHLLLQRNTITNFPTTSQ